MSKNGWLTLGLALVATFLLSGCATTQLETKVRMTQSLFVDPVAKERRIVFISARNTSGNSVQLAPHIIASLEQKGYTITDNPDEANYVLMTNVLYSNKKRENNAADAAVVGGMGGLMVGSYNQNTMTGAIGGAAAGALIGGLIGKATEDTIYQMQVDVLVKQRTQGKVQASRSNTGGQASVTDGNRAGFTNSFGGNVRDAEGGGKINDRSFETRSQSFESDFIEQKTTIFAEATRRNLTLDEAIPILERKIAEQIGGLF